MVVLDWLEAFDEYAAKAPVNYPGPQRKADQARILFWHLLTKEEQALLSVARGHAVGVSNSSRREHDWACARVRKRLTQDD